MTTTSTSLIDKARAVTASRGGQVPRLVALVHATQKGERAAVLDLIAVAIDPTRTDVSIAGAAEVLSEVFGEEVKPERLRVHGAKILAECTR